MPIQSAAWRTWNKLSKTLIELMKRIDLNLTGLSLLLMIGFLFAGCKVDDVFDQGGEEQESIFILTPEDIISFADSLPPGYRFYTWRTTIPSTHYSISFNAIENVSWKAPVRLLFEATCRQVPYEGDITIQGAAHTGGASLGIDLLFVRETTEEILFSADTVWELGTIDLMEEDPSFVTGVGLEIRTGGTEEDDLAYLRKVLKEVKVTVTYKTRRK
jgi:hypothetical protein